MARINTVQIVMALALAAILLQGTTAETHTVGGSTGWTSRLNSNTFYSTWAANITFREGDELVFDFTSGAHDVAIVTKAAYDACNTTEQTNPMTTPPVTVLLNRTGEFNFICTFNGHCSQGQKLAINVTSANSPPTTVTTSPPPPSGSSASSRGIAFAFVLMSLAIAFFC